MVTADGDRRRQLAAGDHLVELQAGLVALAVAEPADAGGQALEGNLLAAISIHRLRCSFSGKSSRIALSVAAMSLGSPDSAAQRNGPRPSSNSGRMYAGRSRGTRMRGRSGLAGLVADGVAVVEDLGALVHEADHRLDVRGHRLAGLLGEVLRSLAASAFMSAKSTPSGRYDSGSCADVWSVTMSIGASMASSAGKISAALPTRPIDSGLRRHGPRWPAAARARCCRPWCRGTCARCGGRCG